jgi:hypothetical protein
MQRIITLLIVLAGIALAAAGIYLIVLGPDASLPQVQPAKIAEGDQEIAWLHPATTATTWERFVAGLNELADVEVDDSAAFPEESMKQPAVRISKAGHKGNLWIRWYKLTGLRTTEVWVRDLCQRQPPPLAIVGGSNSERARDLALQLAKHRKLSEPLRVPPAGQGKVEVATSHTAANTKPPVSRLPVLLITTATADQVQHPDLGEIDLMYLYSDRSFRFCFTNRQMAEAICDFARDQMSGDPSLQLTSPRISLLSWRDDLFSEDLTKQFGENWSVPTTVVQHPLVWSFHIPHSVGSQTEPNRVESEAVQKLVKETLSETLTLRGRELLVLPGSAALTRRVLRGLVRLDPNERFFWVVTTGDALSWNNIYRDRRLAWNIEDVPFPLIVFMHRNPVERNLHENDSFATESETVGSARCTGTDDLLLYRDIGQALVRTCFRAGVVLNDPDQLITRLREEQDESGFSIFDALGNRQGKGGEFITLLRPLYDGLHVLPFSNIEVYHRDPASQHWQKIESIRADYGSKQSGGARP